MDILFLLELFSVITGLGFIILMIAQNIWCWPIGILSSLTSIFLFYMTQYYAEAFTYFFYILVGIYGWYTWNRERDENAKVITTGIGYHSAIFIGGSLIAFTVGYLLDSYTDAKRAFADSTSTIFSLIASYMEAHRILSSWFLWIAINLFSVWLYMDRGLKLYAGLMVIYFLLSIAGFLHWNKLHKREDVATVS